LLLASTAPASAASDDWFYRSWQSDEGLPDNTVYGLAQTSDGYLWIGTASGLARFEGIRFENFSPTNFVAPPNRGTMAMLLSRGGGLRLAMERGAVVYLEAGSSRVFTAGKDLPNLIPNGLAEDAEGGLWIAYRGGAVCRLKGQVTAFASEWPAPGTDMRPPATIKAASGLPKRASSATFATYFHTVQHLSSARAAGYGQGRWRWLCSGFQLFVEASGVPGLGQFHPHGPTRRPA
jgi:ligand-binding sensor domain-containing protein